MKGWTWDEEFAQEVPEVQYGTGYSLTQKTPKPDGFVKDEKTGLLLPEGLKLRPVKIGFQPKVEQ